MGRKRKKEEKERKDSKCKRNITASGYARIGKSSMHIYRGGGELTSNIHACIKQSMPQT